MHSETYVKRPPQGPKKWPLLTGGRCLEGGLCCEYQNWDCKIVAAVGRWSLFVGGR